MPQDEMDQQWQARSQQAHQAIARWRRAHPKATLAEIEAAIDQELDQVRARLIEDVAQQEEGEPAKESGWTCPQCGAQMHCRGQRKRSLQTRGGQQVTLSRDYQSCPACGYSFFPLDEALELPGAALLPHAHQSLLRLATVMPFDQAARALDALLGLQISVSTVRRQTLQAGRIMEAIQAEQAQPQQGRPRFPLRAQEPPSRLAIGSDGGMVPLRGGQWAEVKTLVIGEVLASSAEQKQTRSHSYFSRLCDAQTFADLASAEIARRGVAQAQQVCAIQDGAEWLQGFVDGHRADALRILDFAHAAGYLGQVAEQGRLAGYHVPASWLAIVLHELKHHGPDRLLKHLAWGQAHRPSAGVTDALRYLGKRRAQLDYPRFREQGWPLGSGMVESANKLLMQARLKGAGMHWQQGNVNPMLALRGALCNERWDESWQDHQRWRQDDRHAKRRERSARLRARLICHLKEQIVRIALLLPSSILAGPPTAPKGRTQAQQRWGRQTFSSRRLREQALAKI